MTEKEVHELRELGHDFMAISYDYKKKDRKKLKNKAKLLYKAADIVESKTNWKVRAEWLYHNKEHYETGVYKHITDKIFKEN